MTQASLGGYLSEVLRDIQKQDGYGVSYSLSHKHPHAHNPRLRIKDPEAKCEEILPQPWDEIVAAHIRALWACNQQQLYEAYQCQAVAVQAFTKLFQGMKDDNWALPVMFVLCTDVRLLANSAETLSRKIPGSKPIPRGELLEKTAELLMGLFRVCASDNRSAMPVSKKWGLLTVVNQLLKIYFRINKLHLCKPLTRAVEQIQFKDQFNLSQLVTYRYYVGRKALFENEFKTADELLTFAFERCHRASHANKRMILISLLPVKMLMGKLPSKRVLDKYKLQQFHKVVDSVRQGNLLGLTEALAENEAFFIKTGVYLILEKLKIITYRNLFKKVWLILRTHLLPVKDFLSALQLMNVEEVDLDEAECIIANLIFEGKVKGYISHGHRTVVVSKQDPFPKITEAPKVDT